MPSTINSDDGVVSGTSGLKTSGGNDGLLNIQTNGSTAMSINASQQVTFNNGANLPNTFGFKNRIINGGMVIDQRNDGASVTPISGQYLVDRWRAGVSAASKYSVQQNAGSVTSPTGFSNYLGVTSLSAYSVGSSDVFFVGQRIEGFNTADLAFGTASAQTITVSFWVRSSLTGTFCVAIGNAAFTRSYVATYTVNTANTWEYKTVTIAGDTTGTWVGSTNGVGLFLTFSLGTGSTYNTTASTWAAGEFYGVSGAQSVVGTNGATFYITGVQLERGSAATSFDFRSYGTELALCQRYYYRTSPVSSQRICMSFNSTTTIAYGLVPFPVTMRTAPTALDQSGTSGNYGIVYLATAQTCSAVPTFLTADTAGGMAQFTVSSGLTAGQGSAFYPVNTSGYLGWSAEL